MAITIRKIQKEHCPAARLIGKKCDIQSMGQDGWQSDLHAASERTAPLPFNGDAVISAVHIVNGRPEYWIGMLFPADTAVPDELDAMDMAPMDYAISIEA